MKSPIIISENGDLSFYRSASDAAIDMEAIDVLHGEYKGYDAEGRLLNIEVSEDGHILIDLAEKTPGHASELAEEIVDFLFKVEGKDLSHVDLNTLVFRCMHYFI